MIRYHFGGCSGTLFYLYVIVVNTWHLKLVLAEV